MGGVERRKEARREAYTHMECDSFILSSYILIHPTLFFLFSLTSLLASLSPSSFSSPLLSTIPYPIPYPPHPPPHHSPYPLSRPNLPIRTTHQQNLAILHTPTTRAARRVIARVDPLIGVAGPRGDDMLGGAVLDRVEVGELVAFAGVSFVTWGKRGGKGEEKKRGREEERKRGREEERKREKNIRAKNSRLTKIRRINQNLTRSK